MASRGSGRSAYVKYATQQARKWGVPVNVFLAQIEQESHWDPKARSSANAQGIAQFTPGLFSTLVNRYRMVGASPWNPYQSIEMMARYMGGLIHQYGNLYDPLSIYNSGKPWNQGQNIGQTNAYVNSILNSTQNNGGHYGGTGYVHPLPGVPQGRTDEGVDFAPKAGTRIQAMGNGVVDFIGHYHGFGTYMAYHLTDGPYAGKEIYLAEGINLSVKVGQKVSAGQALAISTGASTGIETGWAHPSGNYLPLATGSYVEGQPSQWGKDFASFLSNLSGTPTGFGSGASISSDAAAQQSSMDQSAAFQSSFSLGLPATTDMSQPQILSPGTVPADNPGPRRWADTWQTLSSQPLASAETQMLAQRAAIASGG